MKKNSFAISAFIFCISVFIACGGENQKNSSSSVNKSSEPVELCKCLTEPGNSPYMQTNGDACDELISSEIGVDDWTKVNMSQNPEISNRFDALAERCQ